MRGKIKLDDIVFFCNCYPDYKEFEYSLGTVVGMGNLFCIVKYEKDNQVMYFKVCKFKLYKTNYKIKKGIIEI